MGDKMKSYKLVNSREVQEKAFRLGYEVNKDFIDDPFIILYAEGKALKFSDIIDYANCDIQEITQADFLALPEPIKEFDWIRVSVNYTGFIICKAYTIENINGALIIRNSEGKGYTSSICTKLTEEQIEILSLE